jgi:excisionase family DNA binding protein
MQSRNEEGRLTMDVADAAKLLGISVGAAYRAARTGGIPTVRLGDRVLVLREPFLNMLSGKQMGAA